MVATTVTPEMVRVAFLLKIGRSNFASSTESTAIKSAFEGTFSRWYLPEVLIFKQFTSS